MVTGTSSNLLTLKAQYTGNEQKQKDEIYTMKVALAIDSSIN